MRKIILLLAIRVLAFAGTIGGAAWAAVEFILHLVKDKEFNWASLLVLAVSAIALTVVNAILALILAAKRAKKCKSFKDRVKEMQDV